MDKKNANGFSSKAPESGSQRKQLPYSVETPYGFHLDLDFLKYVDDIEKGNTIKKVHIQRRNKGPKFSTLPRNFSLPGHASRAAPKDSWTSTSTLGPKPKSRVMEVQQIFEFRACEGGSQGHPRAPGVIHKSNREDGSVREFDEQPLGIHVRPHLLRASSMPVTVMQRKSSEPVEDKGAQAAGDSCRENGSSENVFISSDMDKRCDAPQDQAVLHQQFATALQRIRELEEQVRTIPELRAEICTLRKEKEHLLLKLNSQTSLITEDSMQNAGNDGAGDQIQITVTSEESVVSDAAPSLDQQVLPSPVQEPDQHSVTEQQESEVHEDTGRPLENLSGKQEVVPESPLPQEPTELEPEDSSTPQELVMQDEITAPPHEPAEEEPAQSSSTQELVKDEIAESSSVQEPSEPGPEECLITQVLPKDGIVECSSVQEPAEQELEESSTTHELLIQDKIAECSLQVPTEEPEQGPSTQELVMHYVIVERCKTPELVEQELADSPSTLVSVKQEEETESSPTLELVKHDDEATSSSALESVKQEEEAESSPALETVKKDEEAVSSSARKFEEHETTEPTTAPESEGKEAGEAPTAEEPVKQDELSENSSAQEPVKQDELSENSSAQEPAEQETLESPPAQESLKLDEVSVSSPAQEFIEQEIKEPLTAQESTQQETTESPVVEESMKQGEVEDNSSTPEAAEQETTMDPVAQKPMVQDEVLESSSARESVLQELTVETLTVKEETTTLVIMEGHSGEEKVVTEGDQLSSVSENLTIKVLQEKLMALEEKFSDVNKELENTNALLREQIEENKLKEERIKLLTEETKAEKVQVEQESGDLGDTSSSDPTLTCDASVSTDSAPELLSKGVSTDREPLLSDTLAITVEQQKNLISTTTQTDFTEAQVSADTFRVQKHEEAELTVHFQVVENTPQEEPCSNVQMQPETAVEAESSQPAASDSAEEASSSPKTTQPCQSSQEPEPSPPGPSESPAPNAAIGQYVNRIQGLLNEQWAGLGSGHPEIATTLNKPASKFSSIQTQLVSSLSALSAFYSSPGQKGGSNRQAALKSIMKKNDDKPGNGGAKKNLKFVGVNGGYETTSSEESSEEDNAEDSSEPEEKEEKEEKEGEKEEKEGDMAVPEVATAEEPACEGAQAAGPDCDTVAPEASSGLQEEQPGGETVDEGFMTACHFIKDRQAEIEAPDKEMKDALMVLYQEWFRVSSQKDSVVDTVTLYLKEVGAATPTLLRFLVNLADGNGNTALHYSVSHSNFPIVKLLLDTGLCEVDIQNKAGYTAIMLASLTTAEGPEDMEVALQLLSQGNVNARASQAGQTALMLAVSHGRVAMVRLLLGCGAEVNTQDQDGSTALMCACEHGHAEIARLLLERPECDLSLTDREGHSALEVAMQASQSELVELLKAHTSEEASHTPSLL
ncbi:hypothetical protein COCON_G00061320 [Conger conger]|uniref:KN motif and ankyrin repeat domain-containing protein 4 n=1 Tax=Conger conger TaxID=82655 RepID=A0A9Q1I3G0_CONCO|nr:hypothetical protein COCON_G00061320 [Conger conger]